MTTASTPTTLQRAIYGFRLVETRFGDTLQAIALRELGDASRWPELIAYNGLVPPYLVDDPSLAAAGLIVTGRLIKVPSSSTTVSSDVDPSAVFGRDVLLAGDGDVAIADGDFAPVIGTDNLKQAISNAINTAQRDLIFHPTYGCEVFDLLGTTNNPVSALLGAEYVKATVQADARISSVQSAVADVSGDALSVTVVAIPIAGRAVEVTI